MAGFDPYAHPHQVRSPRSGDTIRCRERESGVQVREAPPVELLPPSVSVGITQEDWRNLAGATLLPRDPLLPSFLDAVNDVGLEGVNRWQAPAASTLREAPPPAWLPDLFFAAAGLRDAITALARDLDAARIDGVESAADRLGERFLGAMTEVAALVEVLRSDVSRLGPVAIGRVEVTLSRFVTALCDWGAKLTSEVLAVVREERWGAGDPWSAVRHLAELSSLEVRGFVGPRLGEARAEIRGAAVHHPEVRLLRDKTDALEERIVVLNGDLGRGLR